MASLVDSYKSHTALKPSNWSETFHQMVEKEVEETFRPYFDRLGDVVKLILITRLISHAEKPSCPHQCNERRILSEFQYEKPISFSKMQEIIKTKFSANVIEPTTQSLSDPQKCRMKFIVAAYFPSGRPKWQEFVLFHCQSPRHGPEFETAKDLEDFITETTLETLYFSDKEIKERFQKEPKPVSV